MKPQEAKPIIKKFVEENTALTFQTLKELCAIPAPSHKEEKRAEYCKAWLEKYGVNGVYIDEALNVVFPINCDGSREITAISAHTDTVFPDMEPLPYREDDENIYCPGVGDDTVSVVSLLLLAKFITENNIAPSKGFMIVCNSCEEGLGNLKGTRRIFEDFEGRIKRFIAVDSGLNSISDRCAGSHRYEVEVKTEGGHSYSAFGKPNANAVLAEMISKIYKLEVPQKEGSRTTYNVGIISGGTSVNTICQNAKMLCEYRSNDRECLAIMQENFERIFEESRSDKVEVLVNMVGNRPCSNIDTQKIEELKQLVVPVIESVIGEPVRFKCSSTDCNIPLSLGIPAISMGMNYHYGSHTREEYLVKSSVPVGIESLLNVAMELMNE